MHTCTHTPNYLEVFLQLLFFSEFLEVTARLGLLSLLGKLSGRRGAEEKERGRELTGKREQTERETGKRI